MSLHKEVPKLKVFKAIVIGGGINGLSAAYHLCRLGYKKVGLVEQWKIGHDRGSSHGPSRITRSAYSHSDYVRLMQWCHAEEWPRLECDAGQKFLFPQLRFQESMGVLLDHTAGIIAADHVITNLKKILLKSNTEIIEETKVLAIDRTSNPILITTDKGPLQTERLIVTAGTWASNFFDFLKPKLKVARQTVAYLKLKGPATDFQPGRFPIWIYLDDRPEYFFYGLPEFGINGIKFARHFTENRNDNPNDQPPIDVAETKIIRQFIGKLLTAPLEKIIKLERCLYTYTVKEKQPSPFLNR